MISAGVALAGLQDPVAAADADAVAHARGAARRAAPGAAGVVAVEQELPEHAALDDHVAPRAHAFAVERARAELPGQRRVIDDVTSGDATASPSRSARNVERLNSASPLAAPAMMSTRRAAHRRLPDDRHLARRDLPPAELAHDARRGLPADVLGRLEPVEHALGAEPVVALLLAVGVVGEDGDGEARRRVGKAAAEAEAVRQHDWPALRAELGALGVGDAAVEVERRLLRAQDDVLHLVDASATRCARRRAAARRPCRSRGLPSRAARRTRRAR